MGYDPLVSAIKRYKGSELIIEWNNGLKVIGEPDTIFETDNGLEDNDKAYVEYDAVAFHVNDVLCPPKTEKGNIYQWLIEKKGSLIEISLYENSPSAIYLTDGQMVWKMENL